MAHLVIVKQNVKLLLFFFNANSDQYVNVVTYIKTRKNSIA